MLKGFHFVLCLVFLQFFAVSPVFSQWRKLTKPPENGARDVTISNNYRIYVTTRNDYAGYGGKIYEYLGKAQKWEQIPGLAESISFVDDTDNISYSYPLVVNKTNDAFIWLGDRWMKFDTYEYKILDTGNLVRWNSQYTKRITKPIFIDSENSWVWLWNGDFFGYKYTPGDLFLKRIDCGIVTVAGVDMDGGLWWSDADAGINSEWFKVDTLDFAVQDVGIGVTWDDQNNTFTEYLWLVGTDDRIGYLYKNPGDPTIHYQQIQGLARRIAVTPSGIPVVANSMGDVFIGDSSMNRKPFHKKD